MRTTPWEEDFRAVVAAIVSGVPQLALDGDKVRRVVDAAKEVADEMTAIRDAERDRKAALEEESKIAPSFAQIFVVEDRSDGEHHLYALDREGRVWYSTHLGSSVWPGWTLMSNRSDGSSSG